MSNTLPSSLQPVLTSSYPIRPRLLFLLQRQSRVTNEQFAQALSRCRQQFPADAVGAGSVVARAGIGLAEEQSFINQIFGGAPVKPLDAYLTLDLESYEPSAADFERLIGLARTCLEPAAGLIDGAASTVFVGVANLAIPGYAPLAMILNLTRAPHHSLEDYNSWWVHHGDDHRITNPGQMGYHQLHSAPEYNAAAAKAAGVSVSELCIIDMMYLGSKQHAVSAGDPDSAETQRVSAEIGQNVAFGTIRGSFFREL